MTLITLDILYMLLPQKVQVNKLYRIYLIIGIHYFSQLALIIICYQYWFDYHYLMDY
jgi:hypothetical protein